MNTPTFNTVELFAGGGGMALGTQRAGFAHLALLEVNRHAVATLRHNAEKEVGVRPELPIEITDVSEFDYNGIHARVDLLAGGAPCQPFSLGGKHAGQRDGRNLFPEVFRAQRALRPKAVLLENVRGLTRRTFGPYLQYILLQLALPGLEPRQGEAWKHHTDRLLACLAKNDHGNSPAYDVSIGLRECADFGLPQRRSRIFIIAIRTDLGGPLDVPGGDHSKERLDFDQFVSGDYWARHALRRAEPNGMRLPLSQPPTAPWRTVRDALAHVPPPNTGKPNGYHSNHVGVPGARSYPGHTGSPWDEPAKTLKAGVHGVPGGENMLRDEDGSVRYFTIHEAAILQGFPPEFEFCGSRSEAMRQIGNAAPPPVCAAIATEIRHRLETFAGKTQSNGRAPHIDLVRLEQPGLL